MATIKIPVSAGELLDKITILEIKAKQIKDKDKLRSVKSELNMLNEVLESIRKKHANKDEHLNSLKEDLFNINLSLWRIEDKIRLMEAKKNYGKDFIILARTIYIRNDERSAIKNKINILLESKISDIKLYNKY